MRGNTTGCILHVQNASYDLTNETFQREYRTVTDAISPPYAVNATVLDIDLILVQEPQPTVIPPPHLLTSPPCQVTNQVTSLLNHRARA